MAQDFGVFCMTVITPVIQGGGLPARAGIFGPFSVVVSVQRGEDVGAGADGPCRGFNPSKQAGQGKALFSAKSSSVAWMRAWIQKTDLKIKAVSVGL